MSRFLRLARRFVRVARGRKPAQADTTYSLRGTEWAGVKRRPADRALARATGEACFGEERSRVRGRWTHRPSGVKSCTGRSWNQQAFGISGGRGRGLLREVLAVCVDRVAVEQCGDAIAVEATVRGRRIRLCCSNGGEQKEKTGEMSGAHTHGYLKFRRVFY